VYEAEGIEALFSRHPGYPSLSVQSSGVRLFVEGQIGLSQGDLLTMSEQLVAPGADGCEVATRWLRDVDGEFLLLVSADHNPQVILLTDLYGHLPLYRGRCADGEILTREIGVACDAAVEASPDPLSIASYLSLGFVPGDGTLHSNVDRVDSGTLIRIDRSGIQQFRWAGHAAEAKATAGRERASEIAQEIMHATEQRLRWAGESARVLSLSGGLDSRAVAGSMVRSGEPSLLAATFRDNAAKSLEDVDGARRVAELVGLRWSVHDIPGPTETAEDELFEIKWGLNDLHMATVLPFFHDLILHHGRSVHYFTGDTGVPFRPILPKRRIRSERMFLDRLFSQDGRFLYRRALFDVETSCRAARIRRSVFEDWLLEIAKGCSRGSSWDERYRGFIWDGCVRKWAYEGMDRNRAYFWLCAPLGATRVLNRLLVVQDIHKEHLRFYAQILERIDSKLLSIPRAGERFPPGSPLRALSGHLDAVWNHVVARLGKSRRGPGGAGRREPGSVHRVRDAWKQSEHAQSVLDLETLLDAALTPQRVAIMSTLVRFSHRLEEVRAQR